MTDIDAIAAEFGIETRLGGDPNADQSPGLALGPVGERQREALLDRMAAARAGLEMLEGVLRRTPYADAAFDAIDAAFGQNLEAARLEFQRFRERRDCAGEG